MASVWKKRSPLHQSWWLHAGLYVFVFAGPLAAQEQEIVAEVNECVRCHQEKTPAVYKQHAAGVHAGRAVSCVGCHGGDPRANSKRLGHDTEKGYVSLSVPKEASERCASCHGDQAKMEGVHLDKSVVERWRGSPHGRSVAEGGPRAATCMGCHGSHGILSHRNIGSATYPTKVPSTCGQCHQRDREHMAASPHAAALRHTGMPSCVRCHGKHRADIPLFRKTCEECHQSQDDPAHETVQLMAQLIERADKQIEDLDRVVADALRGGINGDLQTKTRLLEAEQERVRGLRRRVRQVSHSLDVTFLASAVDQLQHGVKTVRAIAAADLDGNNGFTDSTVAMLLTSGTILLLLVSIVLSVFMFRFGRRIKKFGQRRIVKVAP